MYKLALSVALGFMVAAKVDAACKPDPLNEAQFICESSTTTTIVNTVLVPTYVTAGSVAATYIETSVSSVHLPASTAVLHVTSNEALVTVTGPTTGVMPVVTVTVTGNGVPSTVSMGTVTSWVTISQQASTVFVTQSGTATVTATALSGYTTTSSCSPTTTVVSTVTTSAPTASAPAGSVVSYNRQNCNTVICQTGYQIATVSGVARSCVLVYYGSTLTSSTCIPDYCCTPIYGSRPVVRQTTCSASGVVCPANTVLLSNTAGSSVPCVETYSNNVIVSTTCNSAACCSQPKSDWTTTVTAGATSTAKATSKTVSCKTAVKCSVYNKDNKTNYIKRCEVDDCDTDTCCKAL